MANSNYLRSLLRLASRSVNNWIFNLLCLPSLPRGAQKYFRRDENREGRQVRLGEPECSRRMGRHCRRAGATRGGHCNRIDDNNVGTGAGRRLQQAFHVAWHQHNDQKARPAAAKLFQLPKPIIERDLGEFSSSSNLCMYVSTSANNGPTLVRLCDSQARWCESSN